MKREFRAEIKQSKEQQKQVVLQFVHNVEPAIVI